MKYPNRQSTLAVVLCAVLLRAALPLQAAPMGFQDSWMAMGDLGPDWREMYVNYAFTPRDAVGASSTWMRSEDGRMRERVDELTYTRLLKRWNLPNAQANAWLLAGAGSQGASLGVQLDYETRRVYLAGTVRKARYDFSSARAGFSFYETDYDETQPWLIVEARHMPQLSRATEITPMLRLVNKSYFIETGVNRSRQARFNFMYIF